MLAMKIVDAKNGIRNEEVRIVEEIMRSKELESVDNSKLRKQLNNLHRDHNTQNAKTLALQRRLLEMEDIIGKDVEA